MSLSHQYGLGDMPIMYLLRFKAKAFTQLKRILSRRSTKQVQHVWSINRWKSIKDMSAIKLINGNFVPTHPTIAQEEPLLIKINDQDYATLMSSPGLEKELAIGFCFSEGIIHSLKEISYLHFCGSGQEDSSLGRVLKIHIAGAYDNLPKRSLEVRSGCGICGKVMLEQLCKQLIPINSSLTVKTGLLFQMCADMCKSQRLFQNTGSTHAAALFNPHGKMLAHAEDLGRHNALDKVIGLGILKNLTLSETILLLSGRNSYEMTLKALRAQIPVIASVSGITNLAIQLAQTMDCTLIGFLRKSNMEIYTHPQRIIK